MAQLPFVGRDDEQRYYQQLLAGDDGWLLIITGQGGIGKSALLRQLEAITPDSTPVVKLDFADDILRTDALLMLSELALALRPHCDEARHQACDNAIQQGRDELAAVTALQQNIIASGDASVTGNALSMGSAMRERLAQVRERARQAFYRLLDSYQLAQLVCIFDTCEWFSEAESSDVGQWLLNSVLPGIYKRLKSLRKSCVAVIASRVPLSLPTIDEQQRPQRALRMLTEAEVDEYLLSVQMQDATMRQHVYRFSYGHALCVSIIATLWREQHFSMDNLPDLRGEFSERARIKYVVERVLDQRLKAPYRELTRYGVLLRSFNLPLLQAVFPDLHLNLEQFQQLTRYPYIESRGQQHYAFHDLLRTIQAEEIREQEPPLWQRYHERALEFLTANPQASVPSPDRYYHAIALDQDQGVSDWWGAIQDASNYEGQEAAGALLQAAQDPVLTLTANNEANVIYFQARLLHNAYQLKEALESYEEALELYRQVGDRLGEANVLQGQGDLKVGEEDYTKALDLYERAYQLFRSVEAQYNQARLLYYRSDIYEKMGEGALAIGDAENALEIARRINLPFVDTFEKRLAELRGDS